MDNTLGFWIGLFITMAFLGVVAATYEGCTQQYREEHQTERLRLMLGKPKLPAEAGP